jgi:hypothetical protein
MDIYISIEVLVSKTRFGLNIFDNFKREVAGNHLANAFWPNYINLGIFARPVCAVPQHERLRRKGWLRREAMVGGWARCAESTDWLKLHRMDRNKSVGSSHFLFQPLYNLFHKITT